MATRTAFNARTQQLEEAELTMDGNSDIVLTFADKGFIKLPAGLSTEEYNSLLDVHHQANLGQVTKVVQDKILGELADDTPPLPAK